MKNVMDEVDRQVIVHKLIAGEATQELRDQALATVMLSLWGTQELRELIKMVHTEECQKCPFKKKVNDEDDGSSWKSVALRLIQYGGWGLLIIASLLKIKLPM